MAVEELFALIFAVTVFSGVFVIFLAMRQRSEQLQMQHRERMAMIERGQIPLSEQSGAYHARRATNASSRSLSLGIIIVGLGLALMTIVSVAGGSPEAGVGVGGAIAIVGAAFIVRSLVVRPESDSAFGPPSIPPPPKDLQ